MLRLKAYILFVIFAATTATSFASVHHCDGEITDIDFLSAAECEHEAEIHEEHHKESNCSSTCADSDGHSDEHDCCSTTQLNSHQSTLLGESKEQVQLKQLLIVKAIFIDVYEETLLLEPSVYDYRFSPLSEDIFALYQCYLI
ncbi:MAG: hypothetical protein ACI857_000853 [Arenicella sp.]|jgi:hypothetical protein